jgi:ABC-type dipeptide/oligopeptide/nickel transport system permease component
MNAMLFFWFGFRIFLIIQRGTIDSTACGFKEIGMTFGYGELRGLFHDISHIIIPISVLVAVLLITVVRLLEEEVDFDRRRCDRCVTGGDDVE